MMQDWVFQEEFSAAMCGKIYALGFSRVVTGLARRLARVAFLQKISLLSMNVKAKYLVSKFPYKLRES